MRIEAGGESYGSIWSTRTRDRGEPDPNATRLLAAAADQIGQALRQERLAAEARAAEIARQSDALKSSLLQSVSHDLRTPLATIRAAAGTLRPGVGLSESDQQDSADAIDREVEYLNRLVTNLLDLSRIEAGVLRAELDVFELDDFVGQTVERLRSRLAGRPIDVHLDAVPVSVDPVFLDEAVTNALENAIKYTPAGTAIRLTAHQLPGESMVRLTVEDAGPGVPDTLLPRLFEKFYRVPGSSGGSRSGTGIGLAVVHGLVEAMGGRVSARRSDLGGLAIDLDLPAVSLPAQLSGEIEPVSRGPAGRPTVLVVEDDDETRSVVVRELAVRGYQVDVAVDASSALQRWERRRPDLVLLDLGLPDLDGLQVIRRIRREANTPIVILSGRYEEREKVEALERGADDYVTKPFGVDELNARLRLALRHAAGPAADASGRIVVGDLVLDAARHEVRVGETLVDSTPREFEILRVLLSHAGRLVTKGRLLRAVWGEAYQGEDSYVYVHVSQVRRKLAAADPDGSLRDLIATEPGVGYRVREHAAPDRP